MCNNTATYLVSSHYLGLISYSCARRTLWSLVQSPENKFSSVHNTIGVETVNCQYMRAGILTDTVYRIPLSWKLWSGGVL